MKRFKRLHSVDEVVEKLVSMLSSTLSPRIERVSIDDAIGRIAARDYVARFDLPDSDRSVLDGFAVRSGDVAGASQLEPAVLRLIGESRADAPFSETLRPGSTVKVSTGAPLPPGADTVIPVEAVTVREGHVFVYKPFAPGYGVMKKGEDLRAGQAILRKGEAISWWHVGLLASQGYSEVEVFELPRVALFAVGDEVVEPGERLERGRVYNSTCHLLIAYLGSRGFRVSYHGIVSDDKHEIEEALHRSLRDADIVLATGGTSVGERDNTASVFESYVTSEGGTFYHGFLLRPGRPLGIGVAGGKLLASLSGFPVAAWAQVYAVVERIVYSVYGIPWPRDPMVEARAVRRFSSPAGVLDVVRVRVCRRRDSLYLQPLRVTGSGVLSTLVEGNAVLLVPPDSTGFEEGAPVPAYLLHPEIPECDTGADAHEGS